MAFGRLRGSSGCSVGSSSHWPGPRPPSVCVREARAPDLSGRPGACRHRSGPRFGQPSEKPRFRWWREPKRQVERVICARWTYDFPLPIVCRDPVQPSGVRSAPSPCSGGARGAVNLIFSHLAHRTRPRRSAKHRPRPGCSQQTHLRYPRDG